MFSKQLITKWRRGPTTKRVEKPSRPKKARSLGYKAKQGFVVTRCRIKKGGRKRQQIKKARKPSKSGLRKFTPSKSLRKIAEYRVAKRYQNMTLVNSYYLAEDGQNKYLEIILKDGNHPSVR